ncbi:MAG: hypothetical protein GC192_17175 [Bacteroidetes bacterium]|nr:hypothetical protein [Bacteroidota bacterium]
MKNIVNLLKINLLLLLAISFFAACKKDQPTPTPIEGDFSMTNGMNQIVTRNTDPESNGLCFEIAFPVTVAFPDGSTQTANSMEELEGIYNDWFESNPTANECPAIVFPLNVTLEDGSTQSVADEDELFILIENCIDIDFGWEDCFKIQYPVTVQYPDGTATTVNSDGELNQAMNDWYENNPNSSLDPVIDYPITVLKADGTTVELEDDAALTALFDDCFGTVDPGDPVICFEYSFPINVAMPDGTTVAANSYEELDQVILTWFENHPNDTLNFPTIAYPIHLQLENGEIVTVNNDDEFYAVVEGCYGGEGEGGFEDCFTFNYPVTIVFPDGSAPVINSDEELWTAVSNFFENNPNDPGEPTFQYPISVTLTEDGSVVTVNNDDELNAIFEGCYDCVISNGEGLVLGGKQALTAKIAVKQHAKIQSHTQHNRSRLMAKKVAPAKHR